LFILVNQLFGAAFKPALSPFSRNGTLESLGVVMEFLYLPKRIRFGPAVPKNAKLRLVQNPEDTSNPAQ